MESYGHSSSDLTREEKVSSEKEDPSVNNAANSNSEVSNPMNSYGLWTTADLQSHGVEAMAGYTMATGLQQITAETRHIEIPRGANAFYGGPFTPSSVAGGSSGSHYISADGWAHGALTTAHYDHASPYGSAVDRDRAGNPVNLAVVAHLGKC